MKKLLLILMLALIICSPKAFSVENPWKTKLPFKCGLIVYKVSGSMNGKKALYIEDYGKRTAEYQKVTVQMMGIKNTESTTKITTPDWVYEVDNITKQGTKEVNPNKYLIEEFDKLSDSEKEIVARNAEKAGMITTEGFQGEIKKNAATINGYKCDLVNMMGVKMYLFAGTDIPVKTTGNTMGIEIKEEVVSIKKGTPPEKAFKLPKVRYESNQNTEALMKKQAKETIQGLLEGRSMSDMQYDDEDDFVFNDTDGLPFGDEMTDDEAVDFRIHQKENYDEGDYTQEDAAKDLQKGLGKMFKNMF